MHEVGLMAETLRLAEDKAKEAGATRIHEIRMRIGRLAGVVPEALSYAFEVLRDGTLAAEGALKIESVEATCWCATCQLEFATPDLIYECPTCGQASGELRRGREMELISMEIE